MQPRREAQILLRALAYDRSLTHRVDGEVVIGVIAAGDADAAATAMQAAFEGLRGVTVQGHPIVIRTLRYLDGDELGRTLDAAQVAVLYVCTGLDDVLASILRETRKRGVVTLGAVERYVRAGASLGVKNAGDRPKILLNLAAAQLEGADFAGELVRLAEVIR